MDELDKHLRIMRHILYMTDLDTLSWFNAMASVWNARNA